MQKVYIATVQIAVISDNESEACDAMTECLSNGLKYNGAIVDWQYIAKDGVYQLPIFKGEYNITNTEESEIFLP